MVGDQSAQEEKVGKERTGEGGRGPAQHTGRTTTRTKHADKHDHDNRHTSPHTNTIIVSFAPLSPHPSLTRK